MKNTSDNTGLLRLLAGILVLGMGVAWNELARLRGMGDVFQLFSTSPQAFQSDNFLMYMLAGSSVVLVFVMALVAWSFPRLQAHMVVLAPTWLMRITSLLLLAALLFALVVSAADIYRYRVVAVYLVMAVAALGGVMLFSLLVGTGIRLGDLFGEAAREKPVSGEMLDDRQATLVLVLLALAGVLLRLKGYGEAFERDLMVYMTIADRLLDGWSLYVDIWDHKPPAIHWTYASFAAIFGVTPFAILAMGIAAFLVTLLGCYRAGVALGGRLSGVLAAAVWTLVSGDLFLQANQPNVEVFINASLVWAVALMLKKPEALKFPVLVLAGGLFFLASLYKPVAVTVAALVLMAHLYFLAMGREKQFSFSNLQRGLFQTLVPGLVMIAGWVAVCAGFYLVGDFSAFKESVFDYNRAYAGNVWENIVLSFLPSSLSGWFYPYLWLLLTSVAFLLVALVRSGRREVAILFAWLIGAWLARSLPGKYYAHYYQLLLPPMAVVVGWMMASFHALGKRWLGPAFLGLLLPLLVIQVYQLAIPRNEVPMVKYSLHAVEATESRTMADWIKSHHGDDIIYQWGAEPGVYFWSGKPAPVAFFYNYPLEGNSLLSRKYSTETLEQLCRLRPGLIVVNKVKFKKRHPIERWIMANYHPVPGPEGVSLFIFMVPGKTPGESGDSGGESCDVQEFLGK